MRHPEIRPRFERSVAGSATEVLSRFKTCSDPRFVCSVLGPHVQVAIEPEQAHLWSPFLTFEVYDSEHREGVRVTGRFSSNPSFFTMYLFSVGIVLLSTLGFGVVGMSQWMLGMPAWGLWAFPAGALACLGLWALPFLGQTMAHEQLEAMHAHVNGLLDGAVDPASHPTPERDRHAVPVA